MTALALISGTILRTPERRTAKSGSTFLTVVLNVTSNNDLNFWRVAVFDKDVQYEIASDTKECSVYFAGRLTEEVYRRDGGEPRVSLGLTADRALSLRPKTRRDAEAAP